jgi:hypothetical protein
MADWLCTERQLTTEGEVGKLRLRVCERPGSRGSLSIDYAYCVTFTVFSVRVGGSDKYAGNQRESAACYPPAGNCLIQGSLWIFRCTVCPSHEASARSRASHSATSPLARLYREDIAGQRAPSLSVFLSPLCTSHVSLVCWEVLGPSQRGRAVLCAAAGAEAADGSKASFCAAPFAIAYIASCLQHVDVRSSRAVPVFLSSSCPFSLLCTAPDTRVLQLAARFEGSATDMSLLLVSWTSSADVT